MRQETLARRMRWLTPVALAALATAGQVRGGQLFSFEDADTIVGNLPDNSGTITYVGGIDSGAIQYAQGALLRYENVNAFVWGHSYTSDSSHNGPSDLLSHTQATIGATDGAHSMQIHDPTGNFKLDTQFYLNTGSFNPANLQAKYDDMVGSTKFMIDISTPGAPTPNTLPTYETSYADINAGGIGYLSGYAPSFGNYYQFASGPANQTALSTQTYIFDIGGLFTNAGANPWDGVNNYVIMHIPTNSTPGQAADYYFDNVRVINERGSTWQGTSNGNWTDGGRWATGSVPNGVGSVAILSGQGASNGTAALSTTVTLASGVTVGSIIFDAQITDYANDGANASVTSADLLPARVNYTISGAGSITMDVTSGNSEIYVLAGNHTIGVPVVMSDNTVIDLAAGFGADGNPGLPGGGRFSSAPAPSLTFGSTITLANGVTLTKKGAGAVTIGAIRGGGGLVVNGGPLQISAKGTANSPTGTSVVTSLNVVGSGKLDMTNNSMIIDYTGPVGTQVSDIRGHLAAGRLFTSSATTTTRLGYGDNAVLGKTTFAGQSPDSSSILIKYTYAGDADLDGDADGVDIGTWATNFTGELGGLGSSVWTQGDWDYDGDVDGVDAGLWAQAFTGELGGGGLGNIMVNDPTIAPGAAAILRGMGITVVPEPATAGLLAGLGALAITRRRRI